MARRDLWVRGDLRALRFLVLQYQWWDHPEAFRTGCPREFLLDTPCTRRATFARHAAFLHGWEARLAQGSLPQEILRDMEALRPGLQAALAEGDQAAWEALKEVRRLSPQDAPPPAGLLSRQRALRQRAPRACRRSRTPAHRRRHPRPSRRRG